MVIPSAPSPLHFPCPLEAVTVPVTGVPALKTETPLTTTDWARVPVKVSPTLLSFALTVSPIRTTREALRGTTSGGGGAAVMAAPGAAVMAVPGAAVMAAGAAGAGGGAAADVAGAASAAGGGAGVAAGGAAGAA